MSTQAARMSRAMQSVNIAAVRQAMANCGVNVFGLDLLVEWATPHMYAVDVEGWRYTVIPAAGSSYESREHSLGTVLKMLNTGPRLEEVERTLEHPLEVLHLDGHDDFTVPTVTNRGNKFFVIIAKLPPRRSPADEGGAS